VEWGDRFVVVMDTQKIPTGYKNITNLVYFYEDAASIALYKDQFAQKALKTNVNPDLSTNNVKKPVQSMDGSASRQEVIEALEENEVSRITFKKANGEVVSRLASLNKTPVESGTTAVADNDKYLYFIDVNEKKLKKIVFENFIALEVVN
jgi:hypothetical protein